MKRIGLLFAILPVLALFSCGNSGSSPEVNGSTTADDVAVCIWDNVSLRDAPTESGKWLSALSIGETVEYLNETEVDETPKTPITYYKIRLKDDKEGWVRSDFIVIASEPATFTNDCPIYSRPDLLNKTDKQFSAMDIVAVKSESNGFLEVTGKRSDGKWVETGWVKDQALTYTDVDIAVAKFIRKAMELTDEAKKAEAIKEIVENPDFKESVFVSRLASAQKEAVEEITTEVEEIIAEPNTEDIATDTVDVE